MYETFATVDAMARALPKRDILGGTFGACAHVLHLSWIVSRATGHVLAAHRDAAPGRLDCATLIAERRHLHEMGDSGATVLQAAESIWGELQDL